ncbi:MAG: polyhydroxyalkanoate synthesis repressor PhaR [Bdellovibrionales bacterium]|jgi:polyhydroxyalkanoate synthesis repressor PhaR
MCAQTAKQSITIKKYANRRLYNTATSSYVTLEDLSTMVKAGETFNVYDAKTSDDITRSVLTQIIVEEENKTGQQNLLPIGFLRQLISFYGDNLQWMVPKYLEHSMDMLTGNQDQIRDHYKNTFGGMFPFGTTLEEMGKQNMSMFENTMRMFTPFNMGSILGGSESTTEAATPSSSTTSSKPSTASCCSTKSSHDTAPAASCCSASANKNDSTCCKTTTESPSASVTNINKPRTEAPAATNTPMPSVASAAASTGADDMQQKIANLQRQLADLAKSRA